MLKTLSIKNFAIIEDIEISFKEGMNILLGETGAGKSIIIDAVGLLKGNRSDYDKIRNEEKRASIVGTFYLENDDLIRAINEKYDLIGDDRILIVSRTLENGKSFCKINYQSVPQSVLREVMERIVDIHSQHKDTSFFDEKHQIDYLDEYLIDGSPSDFGSVREAYRNAFCAYRDELDEYRRLKEKKTGLEDPELLQYAIDEIENAAIRENEIEEIDEELSRLNAFEKICSAYGEFESHFRKASEDLYLSKKALAQIRDDRFLALSERFESLYYDFDDCFQNLQAEFENLSQSKDRLEYLRQRKSELAPLRRKYGRSTADILDYLAEAKKDADEIAHYDEILDEREKKIAEMKERCSALADRLSKFRKEGAKGLEEEMNRQFESLSLNGAAFQVALVSGTLNESGRDAVKFLLRANVGSKFLPLANVASLGETSRIHLAYKLVFNRLHPAGTIIFDEIDTGISANVGVLVAKKIRNLSRTSQCIVITHLPQMAAVGDAAYFVRKDSDGRTTRTTIRELSGDETVAEIAKMLSGGKVGETELAAAKKLTESMKN